MKGLCMTFSPAVRRLTRSALAALVAVFCLTPTSCAHTTGQAPSGISGPIIDINPRNPATLQNGGNLNLAISEFPGNFNPYNATSADFAQEIGPAIYPRAFFVGPDGSPTLNTDYFTSVGVTGTNPWVVVYTINPKAVWNDGSPITWGDIASQVSALSGADPTFTNGNVHGTPGFDRVASVTRGADDRHAVITFKTPYSEWRGMFAGTNMLLPRSMTATAAAFNNGYLNRPGPSAGPFVADDIDKQGQKIVLHRNPRWWGAAPRLDSITYLTVDPSDQLSALLDSPAPPRIDATRLTSADDIAKAQAHPDHIAVRRAPEIRSSVLIYNGAQGDILADPELRRAINAGIDSGAIVSVMQHGVADNPVPLANQIYVHGQPCYRDTIFVSAYDPDAARKNLDELGWKLNGDVRQKDGKQLIIRGVFNKYDMGAELAQLLQNNFAQIGVKLNIYSPKTNYFGEGDFDIAQLEWSSDAFALSTMEEFYKSNGPDNFGKIGGADIDAKIEQTVTEIHPEKVCDLANRVDSLLWREVYSLPLGQSPGVVAVRSGLANFGAFGMADIDYTSIGFTK